MVDTIDLQTIPSETEASNRPAARAVRPDAYLAPLTVKPASTDDRSFAPIPTSISDGKPRALSATCSGAKRPVEPSLRSPEARSGPDARLAFSLLGDHPRSRTGAFAPLIVDAETVRRPCARRNRRRTGTRNTRGRRPAGPCRSPAIRVAYQFMRSMRFAPCSAGVRWVLSRRLPSRLRSMPVPRSRRPPTR